MTRWIAVGRVVRAHGIQGEVVVRRFGEAEGLLAPGATLRFGEGADAVFRTVLESRPHGREWIVAFEHVEGRVGADALRGAVLHVKESALPVLPSGTYYRYQLVGLRVRTAGGEDLGRIEDILETGAQDVCVVRGGRGEILIPMVEVFVSGVDLENGVVTVTPIPGLLPEPGNEGGIGSAGPAREGDST